MWNEWITNKLRTKTTERQSWRSNFKTKFPYSKLHLKHVTHYIWREPDSEKAFTRRLNPRETNGGTKGRINTKI